LAWYVAQAVYPNQEAKVIYQSTANSKADLPAAQSTASKQ